MRRFAIALTLLLVPGRGFARHVDARLAFAARLSTPGEDPGREFASAAFRRLADRLRAEVRDAATTKPPRDDRRADASVEIDATRIETDASPVMTAEAATVLRRLDRAARRAKSRRSSVRRTLAVGADEIRRVMLERQQKTVAYQDLFDGAAEGELTKSGPRRAAAVGSVVVAGGALFKLFSGYLVASGLVAKKKYRWAAAAATGAVIWAIPFLTISLETLYINGKQGLIDQGWIAAPATPASTWADEHEYMARVDRLLNANDRAIYAYRGGRVTIDLRRTDAILNMLHKSLPTGEEVFARAVARKGLGRAVDQRQIESDEVVYWDEASNDWVMLGLTHE